MICELAALGHEQFTPIEQLGWLNFFIELIVVIVVLAIADRCGEREN